jgi:hypothetical protein
MKKSEQKKNEEILAHVEQLGGGSVWEAECFTVGLHDVAVTDEQIAPLASLVGVEQIALNASQLSVAAIERIARVEGLQSLVLIGSKLSKADVRRLSGYGPEIELVADET